MTDVNDFSFTGEDADGLINTLGNIARRLPKGQWGLLLSIFAAAAGHVEIGADENNERTGTFSGVKVDGGVIDDPEGKSVDDLRKQLRKAYMPGSPPTSIVSMVIPPKNGGP